MKRSEIQFQKGLSMQTFHNQYGQEQQCQKKIFKIQWLNGWACQHCGAKQFYTLKVRQLNQCKHCRNQT